MHRYAGTLAKDEAFSLSGAFSNSQHRRRIRRRHRHLKRQLDRCLAIFEATPVSVPAVPAFPTDNASILSKSSCLIFYLCTVSLTVSVYVGAQFY